MTPTPKVQCETNVRRWLRHHGIDDYSPFVLTEPDRAWLTRDEYVENAFKRMEQNGLLEERWAGNHGRNVIRAYRETVGRGAAQIVIHDVTIEIDFDYWQPWDLVGFVGHGIEVIGNRVFRKKTDPFRVAKQLAKRGINAVDNLSV